MNPTQDAFEQRVAALEGGVGALATSSGQAAQMIALCNLAENGGHIVSSSSLYGGTYNQLHYTFPKLGHRDDASSTTPTTSTRGRRRSGRTRRRSTASRSATRRATSSTSRASSAIAHEAGIPLVIDNTLASPYLCQPLKWGADIITHSATKFIGGHGTSIGGIIVDGGKFDYEGSGRFPNFTEPEPSYHGLAFSQLPEPLWPARYILKARLTYQRDVGAAISPFNAFLMIQGLETLSLRMERHSQNALAVAKWLEARDEVEWVKYPGLASSPWSGRVAKYLPNGTGAILAFGIKGGLEAGQRVHRRPRAAQPPRERRRRAQPGDPPGEHHAPAAHRGGAGDDRRLRRPRAAVGRHRVVPRHPRRPRGGIPGRQGRVAT